MPISSGDKPGPYEILASIGASVLRTKSRSRLDGMMAIRTGSVPIARLPNIYCGCPGRFRKSFAKRENSAFGTR